MVEILIVSTLGTFSPWGIAGAGGRVFISMQVIWAIGASMIVLSGLQWLGRRACFALGVAIVAGHNLLDPIWPASKLADQQWPLWVALHSQMAIQVGPFLFRFAYPLLAWIGVMALGFGISGVFELPAARRNTILLRAGVALTAGFLLVRAIVSYGDSNPWQMQPAGMTATVMDFLNTTKYPPSLDYLLMTLGPAAILCSFADRMTGAIKGSCDVRPRALRLLRGALLPDSPAERVPRNDSGLHGPSDDDHLSVLPERVWHWAAVGVWIWALVVLLLYPFCRWVASVKARRRDWWLSYI